ncbi:unnamed protein product, partial [Heterosigma akashiwo]
GLRVTYLGHSALLFQLEGVNILTDPVFGNTCKSEWPHRFSRPLLRRATPAPLLLHDLPEIHVVLITQNHYDHLEKETIKKLGNSPKYLVPHGLGKFLQRMGIHNFEELTWWQESIYQRVGNTKNGSAATSSQIRFICTPTQHWSGRGLWDKCRSLWCSFAIIGMQSNARAFFAGDTAYCPTFEIIGKEYGPFDFAAIPTGAYEPRSFMANYHCTPEEAVYIHQDVQSKQSLAICWGTFLKGLEPWSKPMIDLRDAKMRHGVKDSEFVGCKPGSSYLINTAREMAGSFEEIKRE